MYNGGQWGFMEVQLKLTKTETTVEGKPSVSIKIESVSWPIFPDPHAALDLHQGAGAHCFLQAETLGSGFGGDEARRDRRCD